MSMGEQQLTLDTAQAGQPLRVTVISHSPIVYWWPVWAAGFVMALLTYLNGITYTFEEKSVLMHPSKNPGVIFTVIFLLVYWMTNVTVRGLASALVVAVILILTLLFAYMNWWDDIFEAVGNLAIHMNLGFYVFFSTAMFLIWAATVFIFDRMRYWVFIPGQMQYMRIWGGAERTFDTRGMSVYKRRDDLFRHWVLGMGSGDLHITTVGADSREFDVMNVMFIGSKIDTIQKLVAMRPDEMQDMHTITAGRPE